jgi:dihydropyrimidine dehydrogenase (NAD+) subunit PreT
MHPVIDLSRCLGCGTCVEACPEDQVLELVHGQAAVIHGARCEGVAACARECPVGAITVTIADLAQRKDVPVLDDRLEAHGAPNLFLAGEVTAQSRVKAAIEHGINVGTQVGERVRANPTTTGALDLVIVGAGPAGLACALEAKRQGLNFVVLEQEAGVGGTIARYPKRKLVLTQPVDLPLHGRLGKDEYSKEELMALWEGIVLEQDLPIRTGERLERVERDPQGDFVVWTSAGSYTTRHLCLALGRRGTPRQLGVPGEELHKVAYALTDAHSYRGRRILVVGGGDGAVEAALGLATQAGNRVTLSYRRAEFHRLHGRNQRRLEQALARGELTAQMQSEVRFIGPTEVLLETHAEGQTQLPNDDVFIMIGGDPPLPLLEASGVSFDPSLRPEVRPHQEQGTGLARALGTAFLLSLGTLTWALLHYDYYGLEPAGRPTHPLHETLRPGRSLGLGLGIAATVLVLFNLLYVVRRSPGSGLKWGSLRSWMTVHVATGVLAVLTALLHAGMQPKDAMGGHAFLALSVLLLTGAIGRYIYAWIPRAANGRELELEEVRARLGRLGAGGGSGDREFSDRAQAEVAKLVADCQWHGSLFGRLLALARGQRDLRRALARLTVEAHAQGISGERRREAFRLARAAHKAATLAAHYEDLRAVMGSWRYLHRWVAALMVVLLVLHVIYALAYGVTGGGA